MSLYDRDYMQEAPRRAFVLRDRPNGLSMTTILILINVGVFFLLNSELARSYVVRDGIIIHALRDQFTVSWHGIVHEYRIWTLISNAFAHQEFYHILGNMYIFWMVASELELFYGKKEILLQYLACAVFASAIYVLYTGLTGAAVIRYRDPDTDIVLTQYVQALGASGVVYAFMVLFAMHFPNRRFVIFMPFPISLKAIQLVGIKVALDLLGLTNPASSVGHAAHLGGALAGFLIFKFGIRFSTLIKPRSKYPDNW